MMMMMTMIVHAKRRERFASVPIVAVGLNVNLVESAMIFVAKDVVQHVVAIVNAVVLVLVGVGIVTGGSVTTDLCLIWATTGFQLTWMLLMTRV